MGTSTMTRETRNKIRYPVLKLADGSRVRENDAVMICNDTGSALYEVTVIAVNVHYIKGKFRMVTVRMNGQRMDVPESRVVRLVEKGDE